MNNFKGIGWFILELYTPKKEVIPPKESTTFIKVNINDTYSKNIKLSTLDNYKVNINNTRKCNIVPDKHSTNNVNSELPSVTKVNINIK